MSEPQNRMTSDPRSSLVERLRTTCGIFTNCRGELNERGCVEVMPIFLDNLGKELQAAVDQIVADGERIARFESETCSMELHHSGVCQFGTRGCVMRLSLAAFRAAQVGEPHD